VSVIVTVLTKGDPKRVEEFASGNGESMQAIIESAKSHGVKRSRAYRPSIR